MTFRDGPLQDGRTPLVWAAVGATVVALVVSLVLLLADRREAMARTGDYGAARSEFDQLAAPVMGVLSAPLRLVADASTDVRGYFFAVSENRRLRARLREMERWRDAAIALKNVNDRYEQLLKLRTEPPIPMLAARVIADARGPFSNARLADSGADQGVRNGQPVISEHGVVGRVIGVGPQVSRVLLLTDVDSRMPVLVDRSNARAILTGDGGPNPRLEYVRGNQALKDGDLLLTSGDGGVFPRGLPVGVAAKDVRGVWRARLYADRQALDYVRILTYVDFAKLQAASLAAAQSPPALDPTQQAQLQQAIALRAQGPQTAIAGSTPAAAAAALAVSTPPASRATASAPAAPTPLRAATAAPKPATGPSASTAATPRPRPAAATSTAAGRVAAGKPTRPRAAATGAGGTASSARSAVPRPPSTSSARTAAAPAGETADQRARRLRLRALTQDAARPRATMRPIPDPRDED